MRAHLDKAKELEQSDNPGFAVIRKRIAQLEQQLANYRAYQADRVAERDHHGAWDVAINMSETECEIAGLKFALDAMVVDKA